MTLNADGSCQNGWTCEHRWNVMKKMVKFRNAVAGAPQLNYWTSVNGDAVSFSRGQKGFFAMAKNGALDQTLQTSNNHSSFEKKNVFRAYFRFFSLNH